MCHPAVLCPGVCQRDGTKCCRRRQQLKVHVPYGRRRYVVQCTCISCITRMCLYVCSSATRTVRRMHLSQSSPLSSPALPLSAAVPVVSLAPPGVVLAEPALPPWISESSQTPSPPDVHQILHNIFHIRFPIF